MTGKISGVGSYIPEEILDNDKLSRMVETNDDWITERTGIKRRHIATAETTVSMAAKAAENALYDASINPTEIDMILVSTISSDVVLPCAACEVQKEIGATNAVGYDINAACTGFVFAYNTAQAFISTGIYKKILVVASESMSKLVNYRDRGTCILFGDGAGAVVIEACDGESYKPVMHSDGNKGNALLCNSRHMANDINEVNIDDTYIKMNGKDVFMFAIRKVPECVHEVLNENHISNEDIDYYVLHQANSRMIDSISKKLKIGIEKFPMNVEEFGNTSSASIPILLADLKAQKKIGSGAKLVLAGFGAGLSWGSCIAQIK